MSRGIPPILTSGRSSARRSSATSWTNTWTYRTPNPCVLCNTFIKWEALLKRGRHAGLSPIATGHYARVREQDGRHIVSKGLDPAKDQSYVLWGVGQESLSFMFLGIGGFHKTEIRELARKSCAFEALANKSESYEICFIPDNDYRGFLKRREPEANAELAHGQLVSTSGEVLGEHDGYPFFTVGQRKGLGIATGSCT
ncbi:MAG: tRNA methyl transferase PRC-barrel domain-containing protein [Flavobacteriales bacterium]